MENDSSRPGIGFIGLLTIVFIALKLMGVINWSWLWVLSPEWIYGVIWLIVNFIVTVCIVGGGKKK